MRSWETGAGRREGRRPPGAGSERSERSRRAPPPTEGKARATGERVAVRVRGVTEARLEWAEPRSYLEPGVGAFAQERVHRADIARRGGSGQPARRHHGERRSDDERRRRLFGFDTAPRVREILFFQAGFSGTSVRKKAREPRSERLSWRRPRKTSAESVSSEVEPRALAPLAPTLARSPRGRARRRRLARSSRSLAGKLRDSRADRSGFSGQVASPDPRTGRASARRLYGRRRWTTRRTRPTRRRGSSPVTPTACWATMPRRTTSTPSTCVSRPPRRSSRRAPAARQNASPSD